MTITRPKVKKSAESFISQAPDAAADSTKKPARKRVMRGKKEQISLTIAPELLAELDELTSPMGQSRAGLIGLAIYRFIEQERRN